LDIGCGTARVLIGVAKKCPSYQFTGIDISDNMLKIASLNIHKERLENKIRLLHADGKDIPFKDKSFDIVMCSDMLHHLPDPLPLLKEIKRLVKDGGNILVRDVLRPPSEFILNLCVNIFGLPYDKVMKKGYRESLYNAFTVGEFKDILSRAGIDKPQISVSFPHFITIISGGRSEA
jgi:ubiquinone/menaquinone biosynthesis C-methylase UbiE